MPQNLPLDLPITNGQTFIIYSKLQRNGTALVIPSAPHIGQTIGVTSKTGIASAVGGLDNANLSISPVVSGGALTWNIQGKAQSVSGTYSFTCTITTNGSDESESGSGEVPQYAPATVAFTFHVLLLDKAHLYFPRTYYFRVGQSLAATSIVPSAVNPVIDYGASQEGALRHGMEGTTETYTQDGVTRTRWVGYASGLTVTHIRNERGSTTDIRLSGTAARPGVYVVWVTCSQWSEGGQYDSLPGSFPPGNGTVPVFVSIYDTELPDGMLGVLVNTPIEQSPIRHPIHFLRARSGANPEPWEAPAAHVCDVSLTEANCWTATFTENPQGQTPVYFEYQLVLASDVWHLQGRYYARGEAAPAWVDLDTVNNPSWTVDDATVYATRPPVAGWPYTTFRADPAFYLESETAGKSGFYSRIGEDAWQQVPVYTPQYEGITMPPEYRNNGGYIIHGDEPGTRKVIAGAVIPYAPPVTEFIAQYPIRDVALNIGDTMLNIASDSDLRINGYGIFPFGHDHRRFVPGNGSSGDLALNASVSFEYTRTQASESFSEGETYTPDAGRVTDYESSENANKANFSLFMTATVGDYQSRSGAELLALLFNSGSMPNISIDRESSEDGLFRYYEYGGGYYDQRHTLTNTETLDTPLNGFAFVALYPTSGIQYVSGTPYRKPQHRTFTAARGDFSGSCTTEITTRETWETTGDEPTVIENTEAGTWSGGGSVSMNELMPIFGDALYTGTMSSYSGTQTYTRSSSGADPVEDPNTGEINMQSNGSWSYSLTWTGEYTNAGGEGLLTEVYTLNGVTTTTKSNDPNGEAFASRVADIQALPRVQGLTWSDAWTSSENAESYSFGGSDESSISN